MASMSTNPWLQPAVLMHTMEVAKLFAFTSFGMLIADFIWFASFDWSIISGERRRRWPQLFYFGAKLGWIAYIALNFSILFAIKPLDCQARMNGVEFLMGFLVICCSGLLAARTICVYTGTAQKVVTIVVTVFGLGLTVAWMEGVTSVNSTWEPAAANAWQEGACNWNSVSPHYFVKYICTIVFDALVLVLTVVGVARMGPSRIGEVLIKQGLLYFLIVTAANLLVAILCWLNYSPLMNLLMAVPSAAVSIMAATRLYVQLADEARPQHSTVTSSQLSNGSSATGKLASFVRRGVAPSRHALFEGVPVVSYHAAGGAAASNEKVGTSVHSGSDLERGSPDADRTIAVRVQHSEEVRTEPLPAHLAGPHFLNEQQLSAIEGEQRVSPTSAAYNFPRLANVHRKKPSDEA